MPDENLDSSFLENAALLLERMGTLKRDPSRLSFGGLDGIAADLRGFRRSFCPAAHNQTNRKKCLERLRYFRAFFAVLSGDEQVEPLAHGIFLDCLRSQIDVKLASRSPYAGATSEDEKKICEECAFFAREFTRLIESVWGLPVTDTV